MPFSAKRPLPAMHSLSVDEINDPLLAIEDVFDFADIEDIRALLWQWLKATATGSYPKQLHRTERSNIFDLYEKIQKLAEASWMLRERSKAGQQAPASV